jgi:hypothetical protein
LRDFKVEIPQVPPAVYVNLGDLHAANLDKEDDEWLSRLSGVVPNRWSRCCVFAMISSVIERPAHITACGVQEVDFVSAALASS